MIYISIMGFRNIH